MTTTERAEWAGAETHPFGPLGATPPIRKRPPVSASTFARRTQPTEFEPRSAKSVECIRASKEADRFGNIRSRSASVGPNRRHPCRMYSRGERSPRTAPPVATFLPKAALAALRRGIPADSGLPGGPTKHPRAWTSVEPLCLRPTVVQLGPDSLPKARRRSFWHETARSQEGPTEVGPILPGTILPPWLLTS